jgi:RND family efflux transporter MFP subunit
MIQNKVMLIRIIVGLVLIVGGIYAVFFVEWGKEQAEETPQIRPLKIFVVGQDVSRQIRKYPGKIAAIEKVTLGFQVDGPLVQLSLRKGQVIKKGDLLARIDPRDFQNRLDSAIAELDQAATQLERIKKAAQSGAVSKTDLTNAQAVFERAEANQKIAQKALEDTQLLSPFEGVVSNIFVDNFQNVQAKEEIVSIQKGQDILIEVNVPEERIIQTKAGGEKARRAAVFDSLPNREFDVRLYEYALEADPVTQTYLITFAMPSPEDVAILPGMTATILEYPPQAAQQQVFLAPIEAVPVDTGGQYYVWRLQKDNDDLYTVHRVNVSVGKPERDKIQILTGLAQEDKIAMGGVHTLKEGQKVREFVPKSKEANP